MSDMFVVKYDTKIEEGIVKSTYIDIGKFRILMSLSHKNWYTKGKQRIIPIWISKKGLFVYRIAIRIGKV
ncbi:hypothetical protein [Brevibacillus sp. NRS-1366]|uniref:hypothetical protein n=1 Tax=Brevibacillus sp. NRS-1366 TaxID=3233899 RepID=UPI003D1F26AA